MRYRFEFWLDKDKPEENDLMERIRTLKDQNKFASTMRKGIVLVPDLDAGNYDVLLQMYPNIVEKLLERAGQSNAVSLPPPPPTDDIKSLEEKVEQLTQVVLQQNIGKSMEQAKTTGKQIAAPTFAMPVFDDDEPDLHVAASKNQDSAFNFVSALKNMQ